MLSIINDKECIITFAQLAAPGRSLSATIRRSQRGGRERGEARPASLRVVRLDRRRRQEEGLAQEAPQGGPSLAVRICGEKDNHMKNSKITRQ